VSDGPAACPAIRSELLALGDALVVMDHFGHDEAQELLGERRVETGLLGQCTQPFDLHPLASLVGRRQLGLCLVAPDRLGDLEPLGEQMHQRRIDVVDAGAVGRKLRIDGRLTHRTDATRAVRAQRRGCGACGWARR
jgi:hypothetical protein